MRYAFQTTFVLAFLLLLPVQGSAALRDQSMQALSRAAQNLPKPTNNQTASFQAFQPWTDIFTQTLILNPMVLPEERRANEDWLEKIAEFDRRCAALSSASPELSECINQRNAASAALQKALVTYAPEYKNEVSFQALNAAYSATEYLPSNLAQQFDQAVKKTNELSDMVKLINDLPKNDTNKALTDTKIPALSVPAIGENIRVKRLAELAAIPISSDPNKGFWDKIKNWQDWFKPGLKQAFSFQVWAATPFGTFGQTGQNQLKVLGASKDLENFAREAEAVNVARDRLITRHNDITGQGMAALHERVQNNLEVMNQITASQKKTLKAIEYICQKQRASIPCWETGNNLPYDQMAEMMGALGSGSANTDKPNIPDLQPYQVWGHCPEPSEPFLREAPGKTFTGLFLEEKQRRVLTLRSNLPAVLHPQGCLVGLAGKDGVEYFVAQVETPESDIDITADLALLQISAIHTEKGQNLASIDFTLDDFVTDWWPKAAAVCPAVPSFEPGQELNLLGFETPSPASPTALKLKALFTSVPEKNGGGRFTANAGETFNGGSVVEPDSGCWAGLAKLKTDPEGLSQQQLIPVSVVRAWLQAQNINLPFPENSAATADTQE